MSLLHEKRSSLSPFLNFDTVLASWHSFLSAPPIEAFSRNLQSCEIEKGGRNLSKKKEKGGRMFVFFSLNSQEGNSNKKGIWDLFTPSFFLSLFIYRSFCKVEAFLLETESESYFWGTYEKRVSFFGSFGIFSPNN